MPSLTGFTWADVVLVLFVLVIAISVVRSLAQRGDKSRGFESPIEGFLPPLITPRSGRELTDSEKEEAGI